MVIKKIFIEEKDIDHPMVRSFSTVLGIAPQLIKNQNQLYDMVKGSVDPWHSAKELLWLTDNKGSFLKKCPGTRDYICCGYQILHIGTFCTMDCAYCILQSYFHPPILQYFLNQHIMMREVDNLLANHTTMRIGTGEFTDSLIWEGCSNSTSELVHRFSLQRHSVLELKTKTTAIRHLESLSHNRKTIISWSLNTPQVIASQERGTSSLEARLRAAAQCQSWGYPLAFHFDPMVIYPGCEKDYAKVLELLFENVSAENIVWISLGTLRFMPSLQNIIKVRFPDSGIIYNEFIAGLDGKMRYLKPLRVRLYRQMVETIKAFASTTTVYLCMEDAQVWESSFGFTPVSCGGLSLMLDNSARAICDLQ